jgi:hypothetical protein
VGRKKHQSIDNYKLSSNYQGPTEWKSLQDKINRLANASFCVTRYIHQSLVRIANKYLLAYPLLVQLNAYTDIYKYYVVSSSFLSLYFTLFYTENMSVKPVNSYQEFKAIIE